MPVRRYLIGILVGFTLFVCILRSSSPKPQLIVSQYAKVAPDQAAASNVLWSNKPYTEHHPIPSPGEAAASTSNDLSRLIDLTDFAYIIEQPPCSVANALENVIKPPGPAESSASILIMVHSAPDNWAKRNVIRETWGRNDRADTRVLFLLGAVRTPQAQHNISKENHLHADILQGNFVDAYRNMTYKHAMALKWFAYNCPGQPYLLKTDDDVFLNTPNALRYLEADTTPRRNLMLCSLQHRAPISRSIGSKWRVSYRDFPGEYFPDYCPGYYILYSADVVQRLYREAQRTPYFWIDDVHMTGTLRIGANLTITPFTGDVFLTLARQVRWEKSGYIAPEDSSRFDSFVFTYPDLSPDRIRNLWREFGEGRGKQL